MVAPDERSGVPVRALLALYEQVQDALDGRRGASSHLAVAGGEERVDDQDATEWEGILGRPLPLIREAISADDDRGADLRQNSPFAGALSEAERREILQEIR